MPALAAVACRKIQSAGCATKRSWIALVEKIRDKVAPKLIAKLVHMPAASVDADLVFLAKFFSIGPYAINDIKASRGHNSFEIAINVDVPSGVTTSFDSLRYLQERWYAAKFYGYRRESFVSNEPLALPSLLVQLKA